MSDIILIACVTITYIFIFCMVKFLIMPYLNKKNELREKDIKNKQHTFFSSVDIDAVEKLVTDYIQKYIDRYIVYKFISVKKEYIKDDEIDPMIKDISKNIMRDMSELYVFYIKLLTNVTNTTELVYYVHNKVMELTIDSVSNYNKSV